MDKQDNHQEFRRDLGVWSASALVAGSMIGTGIFIFVASVAQRLASPAAIVVAWLVGAAMAACGALCLSELAAAYPQTGGIYVYLYRAFGPAIAFLYSWTKFLIMRTGSFGIPALAFAGFSAVFLQIPADPVSQKIIAVSVILALTVINIIGVRLGGVVQNIFTSAKILCLVAIIGVAVAFAIGWLAPQPVTLASKTPTSGNWLLLFCAALIPVMWTFGGWDESPFVAEEVENPERNLPISILGGFALVALFYVIVNACYLSVLTPAEMAASEGKTATYVMQRALGTTIWWLPAPHRILALFLMISTFGAANGMALTGARIVYATGRDQAIFRWFARLNARTRTPVRGLLFQCILAIAAVLLLKDPFQLLLYTGVAYWLFSGLMAASLLILRQRYPQHPRPFRVWGYPFTPIIFILVSGGMVVAIFVENWYNASITLLILAVGILVYNWQYGWNKTTDQP